MRNFCAFAMVVLVLCLFSCTPSREAMPGNRESRSVQLKTLEKITRQEKELETSLAALPGVKKAFAKVRPNRAVILITPSEKGDVTRKTVERINIMTGRITGLKRREITIKLRRIERAEQ